jgi:hypothetical protein
MSEAAPAIVVEHRKELSYLLCQAAEIEHLAMCQYLYAAFSLRTEPGPGLTVEQLETVNRWRTELGRIAGEEMLHWGLVNNLLTAIGSAPFVSRPDLPHRAKGYPPSVQFALLPLSVDSLHHFVYFERPEDVALEDVEAFAPVGMSPAPMAATELQPRGQDFVTQGQLYRSLETGLRHLADTMGEDGLFIGPPWAQATQQAFGWEEMVAVTDLASALQVLDTIVSQGEGASGETSGSHYARFRVILDELRTMTADDPSFVPAHPVTAAIVRTVEGGEPTGPQITDPTTAAVSDLFNVVYDLILQMLCRFFAFGHETDEQSSALAHAAVGLMFGAIRPLGTLLASLPVGPELPGATAGANFQLAYKSNFLLPHRRVAWIRFSERLDEAADFAESIAGGPTATEPAAKVLTSVAGGLRSTLTRLAAHIEAV